MDAVKIFGQMMEKRIETNPKSAARLMDTAFQAYGQVHRLAGKGMPSRRYMLWACNRATGKSLNRPKNSAIVSIFTPCKVLHAMDILPVFPEGLSCYMAAIGCERGLLEKAENSGVPETLCSYHKLLMGLAESDVIPRPSFVLNTTLACDANQLTFRRLSEYYGTPPFCTGCSLPGQRTEYRVPAKAASGYDRLYRGKYRKKAESGQACRDYGAIEAFS